MAAESVLSEVMLEERLVQLFITLCGPLSFYDGFVEVKERLEEPPFPYPPPSLAISSLVSGPCNFIRSSLNQAQSDSHNCGTETMRNLPREAKNIKNV